MDKRTVLWIVFAISLLLLWNNWMRYNGKPGLFSPTPATQTQPVTGPHGQAGSDVPQNTTIPAAGAPAAVPAADAQPVKGELITITTDLVKAQIDTVGGQLVYLELLNQRDIADPSKNVVLLDRSNTRTYVARTGLIGKVGEVLPNHETLFTARPGPRALDGGDTVQVTLDAEQEGVRLSKIFTFRRGEYAIDLQHVVTNQTGAPISPSLYLQLARDGSKPEGETRFYSSFTGVGIYTEAEKYKKVSFDDIANHKVNYPTRADNGWFAIVQHYFVTAFVPQATVVREISTKKQDNGLYVVTNVLPLGSIAPGAATSMNTQLYSGPEETKRLQKVAPGLEFVKDYGYLRIIAEPIFKLMNAIHSVLGNWGWTIIALTILIKLAFFPLSAASYRSMAKMKLVTPKMQSIRERHKDDPAKMNQALMELYKTEKINPLGGCLPIVVQIPVFIALYWVLSASVEMRGAPWLGWVHDLAAPDRLFTIPGINMPIGPLPIIMAISMFVQTKLNPTPPDPMQAKMMMIMPLVFSAMFFFFPSGLVLYWVVNNIWSIAQQWVINKRYGDKTPK